MLLPQCLRLALQPRSLFSYWKLEKSGIYWCQNIKTIATSGILNRSLFFWVNRLFSRGFGNRLSFDDLYSIDKGLASKPLHFKLLSKWETGKQATRFRLLFAVASSLKL